AASASGQSGAVSLAGINAAELRERLGLDVRLGAPGTRRTTLRWSPFRLPRGGGLRVGLAFWRRDHPDDRMIASKARPRPGSDDGIGREGTRGTDRSRWFRRWRSRSVQRPRRDRRASLGLERAPQLAHLQRLLKPGHDALAVQRHPLDDA